MTVDLACNAGNDRCIIGQFVKFETIDSLGDSSGSDFGTDEIKLVK